MDGELQELFNYALSKDVNLFDTADSYVESAIHSFLHAVKALDDVPFMSHWQECWTSWHAWHI